MSNSSSTAPAAADPGVLTEEATAAAEAALLDLITPEGKENPFPAYARLRQAAPVFPSVLGACFVSGYEACKEVVFSDRFGVADADWFDTNEPDWRSHPLMFHVYSTMIGNNPPDHTRLRRLVSHAFNARRIEELRPFVADLTDRLLDAMAERADDGVIDLQEAIGLPVPIRVMAKLLGVPDEDLPPFQSWVRKCGVMFEIAVTPEELAAGDAAYTSIRQYFKRLVAERRSAPRDDLTSALIAVVDSDGDRLTEEELLDTLGFLFAAGFETTAGMVGNSVVALGDAPDQLAPFRESSSGLAAATEELARFDGSIQMTRRIALTDVVLGGVPIPAGTSVVALIGAANRDPQHFPDPDRLDVTRSGTRPLSFGLGAHYCLGAALARMELEEILGRLYQRFPGLRLAAAPVREPGLALRRFASVPVKLF
ncbi:MULTISPECIES: cytochrome P450 [unclassified Streptomyces]|uniref:cytochrome P450 n=1 Tax=unclassified Streptomyces TaxID=2593676 RepID=UPI002741CB09|nr:MULTISPECIES: cytochrome P450 [unclassified Streptomyces]